MTPAIRSFWLGADVVSTECLVIQGSGTAPRLEISIGSRGVVVEIPLSGSGRLYGVVFRVGSTFVEMTVTAEQIAHDMPPLIVRDPYRRRPFVPTLQHPHRHCKQLHGIKMLLWCGVYGVVLNSSPFSVLMVTVILLAAVYGHQIVRYREWTWIPLVFQYEAPDIHQELVASHRHARLAVAGDLAIAAVLANELAFQLFDRVSPYHTAPAVHIVLLTAAAVLALAVLVEHGRAARIVPKRR